MKLIREKFFINSLYIFILRITGAGTGFLFWLLAANFYSPNEIGKVAAAISLMNFIVLISLLGFDLSIVTYIQNKKNQISLINTYITTIIFSSFFIAIILIIFTSLFNNEMDFIFNNIYLLLIFIIFSILLTVLFFQMRVFIALRKAKYSFFQNIILMGRLLILPFLAIFEEFGLFISYGILLIISTIIGNLFIRKNIDNYRYHPIINTNIIRKTISNSLYQYISNIMQNSPMLLMPIIVIFISGSETNAYFYIGWTISNFLLMIPNSIGLSYFAESSFNINNIRKVKKMSYITNIILLSFGIIIYIIFGNFLLGLYGKEYSDASYILLILLAISHIPYSFYITNIYYFRAIKRVKLVAMIYIMYTLSIITISIISLLFIGIEGIGAGYILINTIFMIISMIISRMIKYENNI